MTRQGGRYLAAAVAVLIVPTTACRDRNDSGNLKATEAKVVAALPSDLRLVSAEPDGNLYRIRVYESERQPDVLGKDLRTRFAAAKLRPRPLVSPNRGYTLNGPRYYTRVRIEPIDTGSRLELFTSIED